MKCYIGKIITLDSMNHIYKYLVEDCGNIVFVGDELNKLKVNQTILGGEVYKPQKQSFIKILFKGLFSKKKF